MSTVFCHCPPFATSRVHAIALPRSSVHFHAIAVKFSALGSMPLLQYSLRSSPLPCLAMQMPSQFRSNQINAIACLRFAVAVTRGSVSAVPLQLNADLCYSFALRCDASPFCCCESRSKPLLIPESYTQTYPCLRYANTRFRAERHSQAIR